MATAFLLAAPFAGRSASETWNPGGAGGGNGTWDTSTANWNSGQTWTNRNDAVFSGTGGTITVVNPIVNLMTFSASGPYLFESGTLTLTGTYLGNNMTVNSDITIASTINGLSPSNGVGDFRLAGAGTVTLTGVTTLGAYQLAVDVDVLSIIDGATVNSGIGVIAEGSGGSALATVSGNGSKWTTGGNFTVGYSGAGAVQIVDGGVVSNGDSGYLGFHAGSSGTVTVSGTGSTWTISGDLNAGYLGTGTLLITNGGAVSTGNNDGYGSSIGQYAGSSGMVTVSGTGSTWTNSGSIYVGGTSGGAGGSGLLIVNSGGLVSAAATTVWNTGSLAFGEGATLTSPLVVNGGTLTLVDGQLQTVTLTKALTIAAGSNLNFEVGNGSDRLALSSSPAVTGTASVNLYGLSGMVASGTDVLISASASSLSLGSVYNSGNFNYKLVSTSTSVNVVVSAAPSPLTRAYWVGAVDDLWSILLGGTESDWTTNVAGTVDPHLTPSATTDVIFSADSAANEGDTVLGTDMTIKSLTISDTNAVVISGSSSEPWLAAGTLTISGTSGTTGITINSGGGTVTIGANLYLSGSSQTITVNNAAGLLVSGTLGGNNGLIKSGTGVLTLAGVTTYGGATSIGAGTLLISGSLSGSGPVTVAGGALGGSGYIAGSTTVGSGGLLAPGATISGTAGYVLTLGGNVALNNGSTLAIKIDAASNATDLLLITNGGNLMLAGNDTLTVTLVNGAQLTQSNYVIAILSGGGTITGTFANLNIPSGYAVDYGTGISGELQLIAVPEPGAWAMVAGGAAILGLSRRGRQRKR